LEVAHLHEKVDEMMATSAARLERVEKLLSKPR